MAARETKRVLVAAPLLALGLLVPACRREPADSARLPGAATGPVDRVNPLPNPLPAVAARVNGQAILTVRVASWARARRDRAGDQAEPASSRTGSVREALQQLIARELLFQEAVARGIEPEPRTMERVYDAVRGQERDESRWVSRLESEGLTAQEFKQELRIEGSVAALLRSVAPREPEQVGDIEARTYLSAHPELARLGERYQLHHILVRLAPEASDGERAQALARAEALLERLRAGADFAALARAESQDDISRPRGGDLGEVPREAMPRELETVVRRLAPGQISEVVPSARGFHILRLDGRVPEQEVSFEAARERVTLAVIEAERRRARDELVKKLESAARIEVYL